MSRWMQRTLLACASVSLLLSSAAAAAPLGIAEVSAPAINCVFDGDCRITVNDSTAQITLAGASGEGFLQSRTAAPGEPGTTGQGLIPYEYRIDLRQVAGVLALPCITELALDFGTHQPLDFDGDGSVEDVFVVTGGGLGSVGLAGADKVGDRITFRFEPAVCAGNRPGAGESTFFFGLASGAPPQAVAAEATATLGPPLALDARAPGASAGGPGAGSGLIPCLPGFPVSGDEPVCRCLRDSGHQELRCGVLHPDFFLVRRTPLPIPSGRSFNVEWTLVPIEGRAGKVVVEDALPPGFKRSAGSAPRLEFETGRSGGQAQTLKHQMTTSRRGGTLGMGTLVTFVPAGENAGSAAELFLPIGPAPWPSLDDAPAEPLPFPPADPDFGSDRCGRAAQRLWQEHLDSFGASVFGPSLAAYRDLQVRAARCRRAMPDYTGACAGPGFTTFAGCYMRGDRGCRLVADRAIAACLDAVRTGFDDLLGCHRSGLLPCP